MCCRLRFVYRYCILNRFHDCLVIGRDLLRLLQSVATIPEFYKLWEDMLKDPTSLDPSFTGVYQLLCSSTDKHYVALRITPDMDTKLRFLADKVRFGHQKRLELIYVCCDNISYELIVDIKIGFRNNTCLPQRVNSSFQILYDTCVVLYTLLMR